MRDTNLNGTVRRTSAPAIVIDFGPPLKTEPLLIARARERSFVALSAAAHKSRRGLKAVGDLIGSLLVVAALCWGAYMLLFHGLPALWRSSS